MKKGNLTVYALCVRMYEGATPDARFTFEAKNDKEADKKAFAWAQYQGMSYYTDEVNKSRSDVAFRKAEGIELNWRVNNEYVD